MGSRVLLIYPPAFAGDAPLAAATAHPDMLIFPYGLLTIAADLRSRGCNVEVLNLIGVSCQQAIGAIRQRPADLVGITCYTFHRHAAAALGMAVKRIWPHCYLTVGGSHVTPMPCEWLDHYPAFDSVVIGEGEATMRELVDAIQEGRSPEGIPGTAYRSGGRSVTAPPRARLTALESLGKPWLYYDYSMLQTSRGCPAACTFCSSPAFWSRKQTFRPIEHVLEEIEELVARRG